MADGIVNLVLIAAALYCAYHIALSVSALAALITWPALIAVVLVFVFLVIVAG